MHDETQYLFLQAGERDMTSYTFQNVINPGDPTFNQLLGINDGGLIVGYFGSGAAGHPNQGYTTTLANLKSFTPENFPGSAQTQVIGVNNNGTTVGFYSGTNMGVGMDANYGFSSHNPDVFTSVQDPNTSTALPTNNLLGINNSGIAVGFYVNASGNSRGYTFNTKTDTFSAPINAPGATSTTTADIDAAGDIVGFSTNNGGASFSGFERVGGTFTTLNDPGMVSTQLFGISSNGEFLVGDAVGPKGGMFGVLFNSVTDTWQNFHVGIDPQGLFATTFNGVNDNGAIVGFFVNKAGNTIGLLGRPVATDSASLGSDGGSFASLNAEPSSTRSSAAFDAWSALTPNSGTFDSLHYETAHAQHGASSIAGSIGHGPGSA
jgi:hypothetical protein